MFTFTEKNLSEEQVIDLLLESLEIDYKFAIWISILFRQSVRNSETYSGIYFSKLIQRNEMRLERKGKPGDFDILLIPYKGEQILFERTAVFEIKIVRPSIKNPKRNANSLGITQINGLIEDGFPLIGLVHICITEPTPENECLEIKHYNRPIDVNNSKNNKDYDLENYELVKFDLFPGSAVDNQLRRLISFDLPTFVDLCSFSMSFTDDGNYFVSRNYEKGVGLLERGDFNPKAKIETIKKIKEHFDNYSASKYTKVKFTNTE